MQPGCAGRQLAAADPDSPGGKTASRSADRGAADGYEDHSDCGAGSFETHRGRRFSPGHLPGGAPGAYGGRQQAFGAVLCFQAGDPLGVYRAGAG